MHLSAIRINKIKSISQLRGATLHAERHDEMGKARVREGAVPGEALAWSKGETDRDYLSAFRAHKAELGAAERKNAPLAMQALCVVSPEWVKGAGDLHDRNNPRNTALFEQAKAWAESWAGKGSVFGARLDLDEKGGAVVDLMIAPVLESRGKPVISTQKALTNLKGTTGERNEYSALQTSWADWCRDHLDQSITRGLRREITAREHVSPETYGLIRDEASKALQRPAEGLLEAIKGMDLSRKQAEQLGAYMTLKGEVHAHRQDPLGYQPPDGSLRKAEISDYAASEVAMDRIDPWPSINALRKGAEKIMDIASAFGVGFEKQRDNSSYTLRPDLFPSLLDRMHLAAVVAKCAQFCAFAEGFVKEAFGAARGLSLNYDVEDLSPLRSGAEVARHERALNLRAPEVQQEREQAPTAKVREQDRDSGLDWD